MRTVGISMMFAMLVSASVACGGDDGGNTDNQGDDQTDDITVDDTTDNTTDDTTDNTTPDAPTGGLQGLGQACGGPAMTPCPANAPVCLSTAQGAPGFCAPLCAEDASGTTNAQAQFTTLTPAANPAACTGAFTGTVGVPSCGTVIETVPADNPLMPNKAYTGVDVACVIECSASNQCDAPLTCNAQFGLCLP